MNHRGVFVKRTKKKIPQNNVVTVHNIIIEKNLACKKGKEGKKKHKLPAIDIKNHPNYDVQVQQLPRNPTTLYRTGTSELS